MDDQLEKTVERAKALKPQVPGEYLLRKHNGKRYTTRGFSAIWQRLMGRALAQGKNGEPPAMAQRFSFHDLREVRKRQDLAQAIRRAGWNVLTLHYRGGVLLGWKIGFEDRVEQQHRRCHAHPITQS